MCSFHLAELLHSFHYLLRVPGQAVAILRGTALVFWGASHVLCFLSCPELSNLSLTALIGSDQLLAR